MTLIASIDFLPLGVYSPIFAISFEIFKAYGFKISLMTKFYFDHSVDWLKIITKYYY